MASLLTISNFITNRSLLSQGFREEPINNTYIYASIIMNDPVPQSIDVRPRYVAVVCSILPAQFLSISDIWISLNIMESSNTSSDFNSASVIPSV